MTNPNGSNTEKEATSPPPPRAAEDLENQAAAAGVPAAAAGDSGYGSILRRWKREDLLKKGCLVFRGAGFLFSLLAFIIMASNKHGDWKNFDKYEEYRYVLAIAILSTFYTGLQVFRQVREISTGKELITRQKMTLIDFFGDQTGCCLLVDFSSYTYDKQNARRFRQHIYRCISNSNQHGILCLFCIGIVGSCFGIQTLSSNLHMKSHVLRERL